MTTIYPGLGKTGPWALNDSAVVLNGLLMPDGSLQRTPGNTPTVDGEAPAPAPHTIGLDQGRLRPRGHRHTLYHRGPFVDYEGAPLVVRATVRPQHIALVLRIFAPPRIET